MTDTVQKCDDTEDPCVASKLLALHTSTVCLARTLAEAGVLDRAAFRQELMQGRAWLEKFDHSGHNVAAFDALLDMLMAV